MDSRDVDSSHSGDPRDSCDGRPPSGGFGDVVLRAPPNWTAVGFFGMLGLLHLSISIPALVIGHWEGYLSLAFGTIFVLVAAASTRLRFELAVRPSDRRIRLRYGSQRFALERFIRFAEVRGVRLTMSNRGNGRKPPESKIELLCPLEDVLCPPTAIPRQQALFLAMALNVPLTKVSDEEPPATVGLPPPVGAHGRVPWP